MNIAHALRNAALGFALALTAAAPALASPFGTAPVAEHSYDAGILHVDVYGHGPQNIVLIPGLASGPWVWYGTIDELTAGNGVDDYTIYALTLPGFDGRAPVKAESLFTAFASAFWDFLEQGKIEKPVVIGHSLGGTLAILLGEQHPDRLAGIVAVDGLPVFPMLANATPEQRKAAAAQAASMYANLSPAQELAGEKAYMASVGTNKPELVDSTAASEAQSDPGAIGAWAAEDLNTDLRPGLAAVTVPLLEIAPYNPPDAKPPMNFTQDQVAAFYRSLVAGAPKAEVTVIAPSRHFAMLDQPAAFYAAVKQFLASVR